MRKLLAKMGAAVLVALLSTGTTVRADSIPWAYIAQSTSISANSGPNPITPPSSTITFNGASGSSSSQVGSPNATGVIIYNLSTSSGASDPGDSFNAVPITLSATLTDLNSTSVKTGTVKSSDTITLTGTLSTTNVTKSGNISQATINWTGGTTSVVLGSDSTGWYNYSVAPGFYVVPQPNNPNSPGALQLLVSVTSAQSPTGSGSDPPPATPEPTSLVLAFLGLPLMVVVRRRRKDSRTEETVA